MTVHLPDSEDSTDYNLKYWEPLGEKIAWGSSIIAAAAALPAMFKKKRVYSQISPSAASGPAAVQEVSAEPQELPIELRPVHDKRDRIAQLFNLMAEDYISNGLSLRTVGAQVEEDFVHPYAFLMSIPRDAIHRIFRLRFRSFPLWFVTDGISRGMQRERDSLERLLPAFARVMQKEPQAIMQLIRGADWQGLLRYLFDIPA